MANRSVTLKLTIQPDAAQAKRAIEQVASQLDSAQVNLAKLNTILRNPAVIKAQIEVDKAVAEATRKLESHPLNIQAKIDAAKAAGEARRELEKNPLNIKAKVEQENAEAKHKRVMGKALEQERRKQWQPQTVFGHVAKALGGKVPSAEAPTGMMGKAAESVFGEGAAGEMGSLAGAASGAIAAVAGVAAGIGALGAVAFATVGKFSGRTHQTPP